jgi:site-specific DNA recombinase
MKEKRSIEEVLKKTKRLAFYKRVSTEDQDLEKRQNEVVESYLDRKGIELKEIIPYEEIKSAYRTPHNKREKLQEMIQAAKDKEIDGIIVSDVDRISRQVDEHFELRKLFHELDMPVVIASKGEIYGVTDSKDLVKHLIEDGLTKMESDNISVRTKDTLQKLRDENKFAGGKIPYGYRPVKKAFKDKLKVDGIEQIPDEIQVIIKIFNMYQGGESFAGIAKILRAEFVPGKWSHKKVKYIITNPFYTGYFVYNRKIGSYAFRPQSEWVWEPCSWFEKIHPPISKGQWLSCWKRYMNSCEKNSHYLTSPYYFQGILRCSCGKYMKGVNQITRSRTDNEKHYGYRYYRCSCGMKIEVESLHELFQEFYEGLSLPYQKVSTEVYKRFEKEEALLKKQLSCWMNAHSKEEVAFSNLLSFHQVKDVSSVLLEDSSDELDVAFLIAKRKSEETIQQLKWQIKRAEEEMTKLKALLSDQDRFERVVAASLRHMYNKGNMLRNVIHLMVKECQLLSDTEVNIVFYTMPPEKMKGKRSLSKTYL